MHKMKPRGAILWRRLRSDRVIARPRHLHTSRNNQGDVRGGPVRGIVVKRKPARGIHQIRAFRTHVSQTLGSQWSTFRRLQSPTPTKPKSNRLIGGHNLAEVYPDARTERTDSH